MKTIQQMHDEALEEGASLVQLWYVTAVERCMVRVDDTGCWFFCDDRGERAIAEEDALRLMNGYSTGYADLW
jgi:hypothetical protein